MKTLGGLGPTIIGAMLGQSILSAVFVFSRLYTKARINRSMGWDDHMATFSWVMLLCYSAICSHAATEGYGQHAADLGVEQAALAAKITIIGQTFCIIGIATSKACVAFFLLRIVVFLWHKIVLWVCVIAAAVICILCALFDFIRCDPVAGVWNPTIKAYCWMGTEAFTDLSVGVGVTSVICDFVLALLPWAILWRLNMKTKEKRLIGISMSLGVFAGASGIVRAIELKRLSGRADYTYESVSPILWSSTELCITLCTASMPMLRPLLNKLRGRVSTDDYRGYDKGLSGGTPGQGISLENMNNSTGKRRKGSTKMGLNETTIGVSAMGTYMDQTKRQGSDESVLINRRMEEGAITVITEIETQSKRSGSVTEHTSEYTRR
ncbi:hypothetical protein B0J12DRAFT_735803 [Macrophomina phaseolina]|uniref:Rhodopsin domain-containing protein n=1 Tax=Macrophomina phaseolina TaxID=35725 RepID=A0ABQ8GT25_9PEZI|nr:hypothetical protein B0J12DRAFT_735803 [Macrophomina phaseolina]